MWVKTRGGALVNLALSTHVGITTQGKPCILAACDVLDGELKEGYPLWAGTEAECARAQDAVLHGLRTGKKMLDLTYAMGKRDE